MNDVAWDETGGTCLASIVVCYLFVVSCVKSILSAWFLAGFINASIYVGIWWVCSQSARAHSIRLGWLWSLYPRLFLVKTEARRLLFFLFPNALWMSYSSIIDSIVDDCCKMPFLQKCYFIILGWSGLIFHIVNVWLSSMLRNWILNLMECNYCLSPHKPSYWSGRCNID